MKSIFWVVGSVLASAAFQIALAAGQFRDYYWAAKYLWFLSALSLAIWLILHFKLFSTGATQKSQAQAATPAASSAVADSGKVGDVNTGNIHFAPVIQVGTAQHPATAPVPAPQPKPAAIPKPTLKPSNIKFLSPARRVHLQSEGGHGYDKLVEVPKKSHYEGVIACFRNEGIYGTPVKQFDDVKAYIRYFDADGNEIGRGIKGAYWLGTPYDSVDIRTDDTECVLLLLFQSDFVFTPWKEKRALSFSSSTIDDHIWDTRLSQMPSKIQVRLIDKHRELLLAPVDIEVKDIKPLS